MDDLKEDLQESPPPNSATTLVPKQPEEEIGLLHHQLQEWVNGITKCLNEICSTASDGKLNKEQTVRITNLCRSVNNASSELAVEYQSLKQKTIVAHTNLQALRDKIDLQKQLQDLKKSIDETSKPNTGRFSFADIVKKGDNEFIQPTSNKSIAIYPSDISKSSEETKGLVQKIIRPEEMKLHVRGLRRTKNGGVIISTDSTDDIEKLKKSPQLISSGLTVNEPHKRKPRIVVIGVPTSMQEAEVFRCVYHQNLADQIPNLSLESFLSSIRLSHKSGKKDASSCNYIVEVPARIRKVLITKDRVFVHWSSCAVRDFTIVTRCYKCQHYGHAAKTCRSVASTCGHCGEQGHVMKDCKKKTDAPKCATCLAFKKPCNHKTGCPDCPARKIAEKNYINSVDYDL